jgi:hypothetical protein
MVERWIYGLAAVGSRRPPRCGHSGVEPLRQSVAATGLGEQSGRDPGK